MRRRLGLRQDLGKTKGGIAQHGSLKQRNLYLSSGVTLRSSQPHQSPKNLDDIPSTETQRRGEKVFERLKVGFSRGVESTGSTEVLPRFGKNSYQWDQKGQRLQHEKKPSDPKFSRQKATEKIIANTCHPSVTERGGWRQNRESRVLTRSWTWLQTHERSPWQRAELKPHRGIGQDSK